MVSVFDLMENQGAKLELVDISQKLSALAHDLGRLSDAQPDYSERLDGIYRELKSIGQRLRGIN